MCPCMIDRKTIVSTDRIWVGNKSSQVIGKPEMVQLKRRSCADGITFTQVPAQSRVELIGIKAGTVIAAVSLKFYQLRFIAPAKIISGIIGCVDVCGEYKIRLADQLYPLFLIVNAKSIGRERVRQHKLLNIVIGRFTETILMGEPKAGSQQKAIIGIDSPGKQWHPDAVSAERWAER